MSFNQYAFLAAAAALSFGITSASQAGVVVSSNVPVAICDLCAVSSTLNVTTHGVLTDVNVLLTNLTHSWSADLEIHIISPFGTDVLLADNLGNGVYHYIGTVFDQQAAASIISAGAQFTGTFRPQGSLNAFNGQDMFGTWTLRVFDQFRSDTGSINSWGLDLTTDADADANAVPEPSSLALAGVALAGLAATRRRR